MSQLPTQDHMLPDVADAGSMGALWHHIWKCWGNEVLAAADAVKDLKKSHDIVEKELMKRKPKNGLIVMMLKRFGSKIISYSTCPHTKMEVQWVWHLINCRWQYSPQISAESICWCAESLHPFNLFADRGFKSLMKTGHPQHYIPHPTTVSCDTKTMFVRTRNHISKYLWVSGPSEGSQKHVLTHSMAEVW